ncbi:hypothetical protein BH11PSE9_BH11PSE9_10150 [soil metagenome]
MKSFKLLTLAFGLAASALTPAFAGLSNDLVANGSFEDSPPALSGNDGSYCYQNSAVYQCNYLVPAWDGAMPVMSSTSGAWSATPDRPTDAIQIGLQNDSHISQSISIVTPGLYTLSWSDAGRAGYNEQSYAVAFNGITLATLTTTPGQAWGAHSVTFGALAGNQLLSFTGLNTFGDSTAFIDNISMTAAVPEPTTWALMLGGLIAVGSVARRRQA